MTYHSSKIDYSGRTVDLLLLQFVESPVADTVVLPDVSSEPRTVTGIEKLVQRFALIFLTQLGSVKNCESEGTSFMKSLGLGQIYDNATLQTAVSAANDSTMRQIKAADYDNDTPDDEALSVSTVASVALDRSTSTVSVTINITTVSGDTYTYITPIKAGV